MMSSRTSMQNLFAWRSGGPQPARDWFVLMTLFVVILVVLFVWQWWVFQKVVAGGFKDVQGMQQAREAANADTPEKRLEEWYTIRAREEQKYVTGEYVYSDPSQ